MLEYVEKLSTAPWKIGQEDINKLRKTGFKEANILDMVLVAAYYSFVNRIASGLGVELEDYWEKKT